MAELINGADILLYANTGTDSTPVWTVVAGQRNVAVSEVVAAVDGSSKDQPEARVAGGRYSSTISLDGLYVPTNAAYVSLKAAFRNRTLIKARINEVGVDTEEGKFLVNSFDRNYPDQEESTFSIEMTLDGAYVIL